MAWGITIDFAIRYMDPRADVYDIENKSTNIRTYFLEGFAPWISMRPIPILLNPDYQAC